MKGGNNSNGVPIDFSEYDILTLAALINSSARHSAIVLTDLNAESRAPEKKTHLSYKMKVEKIECFMLPVQSK